MNSYIKQLKESKKLIISIDKKEKFFEIKKPYIIAGPCSIESEKMILNFSKKLKKLGVSAIRAGAYKPATFPVRKKINGWQEGLKKPILLKRGTWATVDEILGAAERILSKGNKNVAICLRGVVGMPSYRHVFPSIRWSPDIMMIPALKELTNIPIIYDPSHSTGYRNFVPAISKAAISAGADGLILEAHPDPEKSISDPDQAIKIEKLKEIINFCYKYKKQF